MSNITAALLCCCEPRDPGNCCTQFPIPLPPSMQVRWTGNIQVAFLQCDCLPDVPNYICPCSGSLMISGGMLASGPLTGAGSQCGYDLDSFDTPGQVSRYCPCACVWEDPPGSGQFYQYCQQNPDGCGLFITPAGAQLNAFGANLLSGKWEARVNFYISPPVTGWWSVSTGLVCGADNYCNHGAIFGGLYFNPLIGEDSVDGLLFSGPDLRFCPDGTVDIRSAFGSYVPQSPFSATCSNTAIVAWDPGTVLVS